MIDSERSYRLEFVGAVGASTGFAVRCCDVSIKEPGRRLEAHAATSDAKVTDDQLLATALRTLADQLEGKR